MDQAADFVDIGLSALERALRDHDGDLRNVQLATVSAEGLPAVRTVVLRAFDRAAAMLEFHSDMRAGKIHDIAHCAEVAVLAWASDEKLQIRFAGRAVLHHNDAVARGRWDALSPGGRKAYGLRAQPGAATPDPDDQSHLCAEEQFRQFAVVRVALTRCDLLRLLPEGRQRRAVGHFENEAVAARWIGP